MWNKLKLVERNWGCIFTIDHQIRRKFYFALRALMYFAIPKPALRFASRILGWAGEASCPSGINCTSHSYFRMAGEAFAPSAMDVF
jgi:hypothetical protein